MSVSPRTGEFSIRLPEEIQKTLSWEKREVRESTMDACEKAFLRAVKEYKEAASSSEKVILLRVSGDGVTGRNDHGEGLLEVEAQVVLKTTIRVGGESKVTYKEHPDVDSFRPGNPIPWPMRFGKYDLEMTSLPDAVEIPWTQERQDWLVGLLNSLQKICEILGEATKDSDTLIQNMARGLLLGAPPSKPEKED